MLKQINFIMIVLVSWLILSCATTYKLGKPYTTEHVSKIVIGKTTESDILTYFGDPWKTGIANGNVVYIYCYEEIIFHHDDSVDQNGNTLIIEFDENNLVKYFYFNIPGKEPDLLTFMMHHEIKIEEEREQQAIQTQIAINANLLN